MNLIIYGIKTYKPTIIDANAAVTTAAADTSFTILALGLNLLVYKSTVSSNAELISSVVITGATITYISTQFIKLILNIIPNIVTIIVAII